MCFSHRCPDSKVKIYTEGGVQVRFIPELRHFKDSPTSSYYLAAGNIRLEPVCPLPCYVKGRRQYFSLFPTILRPHARILAARITY